MMEKRKFTKEEALKALEDLKAMRKRIEWFMTSEDFSWESQRGTFEDIGWDEFVLEKFIKGEEV